MKQPQAKRESGRGQPGPEPPILRGLPGAVETDGLGKIRKHPEKQAERPVFKIKACCLICARGIPKDGIVLCSYSQEESIESWYCKRFLLRDIETGME